VFSKTLLKHASVVFALSGLLGCPATSEREDAGLDASTDAEATPDTAPEARDAGMRDAHASDSGVDTSEPDAALVDAAILDAFTSPDATTCFCDDGISCTRDTCDASGACLHEIACPAGQTCRFGGADEGCVEATRCTRPDQCADLPCQPTLGCVAGRCAYEWEPDQDGDGVASVLCGGADCAPRDSTIPAVEVCNFRDDDCNGVVDDGAALATDRANCGRCGNVCSMGADVCRAGACACNAGRTLCPLEVWPGPTCYDLQADPLHCGSCDTVCPDGSTCEAGLCRYRATWMHGVDVPVWRRLWFAPNGDVVFESVARPTRLFHADRPAEDIAPGPAPFARQIVRLDRDGRLVGITSIPILTLDRYDWRRPGDGITVTDDGFYFVGRVGAETDLAGTHFTPTGALALGFVPRATGAIAWAHPLVVADIYGLAGTRDGSLTLLVTFEPRVFGPPQLRRFDRDGTELPHETRFDELFLSGAQAVWPSVGGGFVVLVFGYPDFAAVGVPVVGDIARSSGAAVFFAPTGLVERAAYIAPFSPEPGVLDERADGSGLLITSSPLQEARRDAPYVEWDASLSDLAAFDGEGVAIARYASDENRVLERWRARRIVESVTFTSVAALRGEAIWLVQDGRGALHLPGALTTISRVDFPPIP
jgi:hypothetical protein